MRYPDAPRLDLVEDLHGHPVADPYRWLEDATDPRTRAWTEAQDALAAEVLGRPADAGAVRRAAGAAGARRRGRRPGLARRRAFSTRRDPGQEHARAAGDARPTAPSRVLVDPMALDPAGTTTLDAWRRPGRATGWPTSSPPAATRSPALRAGRRDRARCSTARSTAAATPPSPGCPAATSCSTCAGSPRPVPAGEEQFHRRVWRHRVGAPADDDVLVHGEGSDPPTYFGVHTSRDGRWLVVSAVGRHRAARRRVDRRPVRERRGLRDVQVGVDAQTAAWVARDGRLWLMSDRDAPRWRLAVADPADPATWAPDAWRDVVPQQPDAVLSDVALVDGPDGGLQVLAVHAVDATDRLSLWAGDGSGAARPMSRGSARAASPASASPPGGRHRRPGWATPTTPPRRRCCAGTPAAPTALTSWEQAEVAGEVPDLAVVETHATSADGTPVHLFVALRLRRPRRASADRALRLRRVQRLAHARLHRTGAGLGGRRGRVGRGQPARRLRARRGVAPGRHAGAQAERLRRLRGRRRAPGRAGLDDARAARRHRRVQRRPAGRRGADPAARPRAAVVCSAPLLDMVRYELFGLGRTWNDEYGTAEDPTSSAGCSATRRTTRVREGDGLPGGAVHDFESDTRVDPLHGRKLAAALQHATASARPVVLRRESRSGTAPARSAGPSAWPPTSSPSCGTHRSRLIP